MTSLREIKERLAAIEQGQGVLLERLDALLSNEKQIASAMNEAMPRIYSDTQQIKGALLLQKFKANEPEIKGINSPIKVGMDEYVRLLKAKGAKPCPAKSRTKKRK
jgi:hypothetical protein